jgi:hypothetical protein
MTYQLKGGEEIRDGVLFGWTGALCKVCEGAGEPINTDRHTCPACAGTGEEHGRMPVQSVELVAADARTINPTYMPDAMARTLRVHTAAGVWDTSYSHAIAILASAGFTAAEVIEYAHEAINIAKGAAA